MRNLAIAIVAFLALSLQDSRQLYYNRGENECTIAVIGGSATIDGRPLIWKNRDVTNADQKYIFIPAAYSEEETTLAYIGNFYAGQPTRCFMGVNEAGFGIINANCYNFPDLLDDKGMDDGELMHLALQRCRDITEWEQFLTETNEIGRKDCWIFGIIDANGAAAMYECDNFNFIKYDAKNPDEAPGGIIIRATFALAGNNNRVGIERYKRATDLIYNRPIFRPIDAKFILQNVSRNFASPACDPYPLPFYGRDGDLPPGFVDVVLTINRFKSRACSVIRGVLPGEDPRLATTFAVLGHPVLSIALPLWVASGEVPSFLHSGDHAPWYNVIAQRYELLYPNKEHPLALNTQYLLDSTGAGVFSYTIPLENWGIEQAEQRLRSWRNQMINPEAIWQAQMEICETLWQGFYNESDSLIMPRRAAERVPAPHQLFNFPNPFNSNTSIHFSLSGADDVSSVTVRIYNVLGEMVADLGEVELVGGLGSVVWGGRDDFGNDVSAGVYFYSVESPGVRTTGKMILLK